MAQVKVDLISDAKDVSREINRTIREVSLLGKAIDTSNDIAVKTWKKTAEAAKEYLDVTHATHEQQLRLAVATRATEDRIEQLGERYAHAGERGERALSNLMRTGSLTGRSLNNLIAAAGDLGLAFSPEGALLAGIGMVGFAIVHHLTEAESKMEELEKKFNDTLINIVSAHSPVEAAHLTMEVYKQALVDIAALQEDVVKAGHGFMDSKLKDLMAAFRLHAGDITLGLMPGSVDKAELAGAHVDRAIEARRENRGLHENDKKLEELKRDREKAHGEIARLVVEQDALTADDVEKSKAVSRALAVTRARLRNLEAETARLGDQKNAVRSALQKKNGPAHLDDFGDKVDYAGDFAKEGRNEAESIASGDANKAVQAGARRDAARREGDRKAAEENQRRIEGARRAAAMQEQLEDQIVERHLLSLGMKDLADMEHAKREYDHQVREIEQLDVSEQTKTRLIQVAMEDRLSKITEINHKIEEETARSVAEAIKILREGLKKEQAAHDQKVKAVESGIDRSLRAVIAGHESLGKVALREALMPIVKELEGKAAEQFVEATARGLIGDYVGAGKHAAAGAAYVAGAGSVMALAGGGAGGGGGGGGGSAGGAGMGASLANNRGTADQLIKIEIVSVQKDPTGREISRINQTIARLNDLNMPVRVVL